MELKHSDIFFPAGKEQEVDRMCIVAHSDDIDFMAFGGIWECLKSGEIFGGVVVTDGAGSPRKGEYADFTSEQMIKARKLEQLESATIGSFGVQALLNYTSEEAKDRLNTDIVDDIAKLIMYFRPKTVYTHNVCDKHPTHIGVMTKVIKAIRCLQPEYRPKLLLGGEVWRSLDWVCDEQKIKVDVTGSEELANKMMAAYKSQIAGGKNYAVATIGRRSANATYSADHSVDEYSQVCYYIDMTPLINDDKLDLYDFAKGLIDNFSGQVKEILGRSYEI